tara:strand:- start:9260 stop:10249 length:990 start_codon:yes stop_codon:yes gene_type:complete
MKENNVLVTGACGFIGYHLSIFLSNIGYKVTGIDNNIRGGERSAIYDFDKHGIDYINCDMKSIQDFQSKCGEKLSSTSKIYHLAAFNGTQNFYSKPYSVILNSSLPTINLINFIVENNIKTKILYTGSSESYANSVIKGIVNIPSDEDSLLSLGSHENPRWSYACAKTYGEYLLFAAGFQYKLDFIIARVHNIYGIRMGLNHFFTDFIRKIKNNNYEILGADQTRSFCHIMDCCRALVLLMDTSQTQQIFNIGSSREIKINKCAEKIMSISNNIGQLIEKPAPEGSVSRRCPDLRKLISAIGNEWEQVSLEDGLVELVDWYSREVDLIK